LGFFYEIIETYNLFWYTYFKNRSGSVFSMQTDEYISKSQLTQYVESGILENNFDIETYNNKVIQRLYHKYFLYFKNMYKNIDSSIALDEEQIKAILCDEDSSLIIAGAGTGKTTTMASKVKYLVDKKGVEPSKILVMSYTKKATMELEKRIVYDFNIPACVTTFHSLGLMYVRRIFANHKCYPIGYEEKEKIFLEYFKEYIFKDKEKLKKVIDVFSSHVPGNSFLFGRFFKKNYEKYDTYESFFEAYKQDKLQSITDLKQWVEERIERLLNADSPRTIKGELVKSKREALIANFLFCNGIDYEYEKIFEELMDDERTYKPDFTLNLFGENVYLEYFGIGDSDSILERKYTENKKRKMEYHKLHGTKIIFIDVISEKKLLDVLEEKLIETGFVFEQKSNLEIFHQLMDNNPLSQLFRFKNFLFDMISVLKTPNKRLHYREIVDDYLPTLNDEERNICTLQFQFINDFYYFYQKKLYGAEDYGFDFDDMIYYASLYLDKLVNEDLIFDYIIIDEYQDVSESRYQFTKKIANKNHSKVVAVGDDWQTIYSFAGSQIDYIYKFQEYYPDAKILKINKTYRNSQQLIDYSGKFIMKNKDQIKKELVSSKSISRPIEFVMFHEKEEYLALKRLIKILYEQNKKQEILILARNNDAINKCFLEEEFIDDIGTKITFVGYEDLKIDGMSIHKSKGLSSDEVILIGLDETFPSFKNDYWLEYLFRNEPNEESIPFAEERRVFYVALTRTRNKVYLLTNENPKKRSPFLNELYLLMTSDKDEVYETV